MANIQGIIVHADGSPVIDAKITLTAKQTSRCILDNIVTTIETDNGAYAFSILPGIYSVALSMPHRYDEELGIIQVYEDSLDGSLNQYLVNAKIDLSPDAEMQQQMILYGFKIHKRQRQMKVEVDSLTDYEEIRHYPVSWSSENGY